jgi:hypothetical protein
MKYGQAWRVALIVVLAGSSWGVRAAGTASTDAPDDSTRVRTLPASAMLGFERVRLPGGERMGLVGAGYVMELSPGWWLGPAVYGAATGHRGGLFTWGGEAQRRWRIGEEWGLVAGLYVGGGGGAGAPVGGGLMLRPHADLMLNLGGWQAGLTASQVRFPSGSISSTQLGVLLMVDDGFLHTAPGHAGERVAFHGRGGLGADRMEVTAGRYASGGNGGSSLGYVGLRLEQQAGQVLSPTLEAAGAAQGGADGYAEMLGGLLAQWPVMGERLRVGGRAAIGLGGGGAVATGGGAIAKVALSGRLRLSKRVSIELEGGQARAFHGGFNTHYAQAALGIALGEDLQGGGTWAPSQTLHEMEWTLGVQDYRHAQRKDGSTRPLQAVALKFNRSISEHFYLSGQAHSATHGGAGAYSVGLVGLGATMRFGPAKAWSAGAEALVGAAGGGGVASRGGAVTQPMAWIGRDLGRYTRLKVGAGYIKSVKGELATPVMEVGLSFAFGTP